MASQSFLRAGVRSPARAVMRPMGSKSILKRPAPLPLSPSPFTANFSFVVSGSKASPHVHFPASPAMVATFTAHSANTYDRGPIVTSPGSVDHSSWMGRMLSPTARNAFKLSDPPKRTPGVANKSVSLAPPTPVLNNNLSVPSPYVDPRSPKPHRTRSGVSFDELTLYVPRGNVGVEGLGKALTTYPRSPYPTAPLEADEADTEEVRGRSADRADTPSGATRSRSLGRNSRRQRDAQNFLSPVKESPHITISSQQPVASRGAEVKMESPETRLNQEFWAAVTLEDSPAVGRSINSPQLMFGRQDGSVWSPRPSKRESRSFMDSMLSPAQKKAFRKGMVASPSPNDPMAAFPSFTVAIKNMDSAITYPPRVRMEY